MMQTTKNDSIPYGLLLGILAAVIFTALALGLLLSGTWLYRLEIGWLGIEASSGYDAGTILQNYRAVTRFLSPFYSGSFSMPDLPASAGGVQHFTEVKQIVVGFYAAGAGCLLLFLLIRIFAKKRLGSRSFSVAAITTLALPLLLIAGIAIDFSGFFVLFHKIFFRNDYWIFDEAADPVIRILPSQYFMHCAVVIALFWVAGSALLFLTARKKRKKTASPLPDGRLSFYR